MCQLLRHQEKEVLEILKRIIKAKCITTDRMKQKINGRGAKQNFQEIYEIFKRTNLRVLQVKKSRAGKSLKYQKKTYTSRINEYLDPHIHMIAKNMFICSQVEIAKINSKETVIKALL